MDGNGTAERYLRFKTNIPHIVALKFADGLSAPAQREGYSDQVAFSLVDGRKMYIAPYAADLIARADIQPGEEFQIGKYEVREGQRRLIRWQVERLASETPLAANLRRSAEIAKAARPGAPPVWNAPVQPTPPQPTPVSRVGPVLHPQRPAPTSSSPTPAAAVSETAPLPGPTNRNGSTQAPPAKIPTKVSYEEAYTEFLVLAGRATRKAEQILGADGGSVRFDSRDVAAIATTMFISAKDSAYLTWGGIK